MSPESQRRWKSHLFRYEVLLLLVLVVEWLVFWHFGTTVNRRGVTVRLVLPDTIDEGLAYFLAEWRQKHGYDPGRS